MERLDIPINGKQGADISGMFPPNSASYSQLRHALEREFREHGSPEVTKIDFDRVSYHPETGRGRLRIVLDISYTFGCEDLLVIKKAQTSEWTFEINGDTATFFSSPYSESRSTADEF